MNFDDLPKNHADVTYVVDEYGDDVVALADDIETYLKKRNDITEAYCASLSKLAKNNAPKNTPQTLRESLFAALGGFDLASAAVLRELKQKTQIICQERITGGSHAYTQDRTAQSKDIHSTTKQWKKVSSIVEKAQKKAEQLAEEEGQAQKKFTKADNDMNVTKAYVQKTYNEYKTRQEAAAQALQEYNSQAEQTRQQYQEYFFSAMPAHLQALQCTDEKMLETLRMALIEYAAQLSNASAAMAAETELLGTQLEGVSLADEIQRIVSLSLGRDNGMQQPALPDQAMPSSPVATVRALYAFEPQNPREELAMKEGELLQILNKHDGWWLAQNNSGQTGYIPSNYVEETV